MRLIIISGLSGSGKSVALNTLEDDDFYCIDNLPLSMLIPFTTHLLESEQHHYDKVAVGIDARNSDEEIKSLPSIIHHLKNQGIDVKIIFLESKEETLIKRYSETRRKHPLTKEGTPLREAIKLEKNLLSDIALHSDLRIDTSSTSVRELRDVVYAQVCEKDHAKLMLLLQSFAFKHGVPYDSDYVFDVRCLPNPYWEPSLRQLTGRDPAVIQFLESNSDAQRMIHSIGSFLENWLPRFREDRRSYVSVSIGCTGGHHRSVYIAEQLAVRLRIHPDTQISIRHRELK